MNTKLPGIAYSLYRALRVTQCRCDMRQAVTTCSRCLALTMYETEFPSLKFTERPHNATIETYLPTSTGQAPQ